jgi:hypothetical protein
LSFHVPIDRAATLRNAEKLIRQGKMPDAIAEYVRLVEDQPRDMELQSDAGSYRDVDERIERLTKVQAGS